MGEVRRLRKKYLHTFFLGARGAQGCERLRRSCTCDGRRLRRFSSSRWKANRFAPVSAEWAARVALVGATDRSAAALASRRICFAPSGRKRSQSRSDIFSLWNGVSRHWTWTTHEVVARCRNDRRSRRHARCKKPPRAPAHPTPDAPPRLAHGAIIGDSAASGAALIAHVAPDAVALNRRSQRSRPSATDPFNAGE